MHLEFLFLVGDDNGLKFRAPINYHSMLYSLTFTAPIIFPPWLTALKVGLHWLVFWVQKDRRGKVQPSYRASASNCSSIGDLAG